MPQPDDEEQREDFAATSESLQDDAERVVAIEHEKQGLDAADPRVDALSIEAERLAGQIQQKSRIERELADDIEKEGSPRRSN
jgi:hypothetical protein